MANEIKPEDQKLVDIVTVKQEKVDDDFSDIFITEKDVFDISVEYYKKDENLYVEGIDENFDKNSKTKKLSITFKYPNQGDIGLINIQSHNTKSSMDGDMSVRDFLALEFHRFNVLIRKWSLNKEINNSNVLSVHPKIIKSFLSKIREKIGMDGII